MGSAAVPQQQGGEVKAGGLRMGISGGRGGRCQTEKMKREEESGSAAVVRSRRTLHSKVSTQRARPESSERCRCCLHQPPGAPATPASLPADSCTALIYFSPPHLAGGLVSITLGRGSGAAGPDSPARALPSWCDSLCRWTAPAGAPAPAG